MQTTQLRLGVWSYQFLIVKDQGFVTYPWVKDCTFDDSSLIDDSKYIMYLIHSTILAYTLLLVFSSLFQKHVNTFLCDNSLMIWPNSDYHFFKKIKNKKELSLFHVVLLFSFLACLDGDLFKAQAAFGSFCTFFFFKKKKKCSLFL